MELMPIDRADPILASLLASCAQDSGPEVQPRHRGEAALAAQQDITGISQMSIQCDFCFRGRHSSSRRPSEGANSGASPRLFPEAG